MRIKTTRGERRLVSLLGPLGAPRARSNRGDAGPPDLPGLEGELGLAGPKGYGRLG